MFKIESENKIKSVLIIDANGKTYFRFENINSPGLEIPINSLKNGIYFAIVVDEQGTYSKKYIKDRE